MTKNSNWQEIANECEYQFPDLKEVDTKYGDLIIIGADLKPSTLIQAYSQGYFPMEVKDESNHKVLGWFSPVERGIIPLNNLRITKSMKQSYKKYSVTIDKCFEDVMRGCMNSDRKGGWINEEFIESYCLLHEMGLAHSVEVHLNNNLVGGLYGVSIGGFYAGESMFSTSRDASKVALMKLVEHMNDQGAKLLDTQWLTDHLASLGAVEVPRSEYLVQLRNAKAQPSIIW